MKLIQLGMGSPLLRPVEALAPSTAAWKREPVRRV